MSHQSETSDRKAVSQSAGRWVLDGIVALWCVLVGFMFYGAYVDPLDIGLETGTATLGYIVMLSVAVVVGGLRYLRRSNHASHAKTDRASAGVLTHDPSERSEDSEIDR